jgi:hypothetical protein
MSHFKRFIKKILNLEGTLINSSDKNELVLMGKL